MIDTYESFLLEKTIDEYFSLNENQAPQEVQNAANDIANEVEKHPEIINDIQSKYSGKSVKEIAKYVYQVIKDPKKVGEYSIIGFIIIKLVDRVIPFGLGDSWFNKMSWTFGIAIIVSLVIYIVARRLQKKK